MRAVRRADEGSELSITYMRDKKTCDGDRETGAS